MLRVLLSSLALALAMPGAAFAAFPYDGHGTPPNDLGGKLEWMYAATPEPGNEPVNSLASELHGVRGASIVDADQSVPTAWKITTGRPDVSIAVLDSGIKWNDAGAMRDLRRKVRLNAGELPQPRHDRATPLSGTTPCADFRAADDADGDGVLTVDDFACDARVERDPAERARRGQPRGVGPADQLDPQDVLIAFSDGSDDDGNGFVDDIAGWDFLDDDNDAYDDVQYGHGTGEAEDSTAEADNGGGLGTCPNCRVVPLRVGDSFIADVNRFGQATIYAADNDVQVVQEALGTLNMSKLGRDAVEYAYRRGTTVIASAADEAAQHHNWPSSYPHVIVVNSVTKYDDTFTPAPRSYLQFTGCTNFSSKITVAIPSVSCSSDATGRASGMAGLIYSAGRDAGVDVTPNEVRQLMASGAVGGTPQADDVDFAAKPEPSCTVAKLATCTQPFLSSPPAAEQLKVVSPLAETQRYPARAGHDQFYGYGRVDMAKAVDAIHRRLLPPSVELWAPDWYDLVDPSRERLPVRATLSARGGRGYTCRVLVAPGSYPNNARTDAPAPGDFEQVPSPVCDGTTVRTDAFDGVVADLDLARLKARFPSSAGAFDGRSPGEGTEEVANGRPANEPYGFVVRVEAEIPADGDRPALRGEDRRNLWLHRDRDLRPGFPKQLPGDVESSPALADLDGDDRNEVVLASSDGVVHALKPDGRELDGWPVRGDRLPLHRGGRAFRSGAVDADGAGAILATTAIGDLDRDGTPEVVAADFEGKVYAWSASGRRLWTREANPDWSGRPLSPFADVRQGERNRTQHGFFASPVLADLDGDGRQEVIAAGMDRHLYAWHDDGAPVAGFPVLVVDRAKVASIDPRTHAVSFKDGVGAQFMQGAIVDTPAVGDLDGDGRPEIVVGTNEEYEVGGDGGLNAANFNTASIATLGKTGAIANSNGRVFAFHADGTPVDGWPLKVARLLPELLPIVGEGVTGSPAIGAVPCGTDTSARPRVGVIPDAGIAYLVGADGRSCLGQENGRDIGLQTDVTGDPGGQRDLPAFAAVGHPAFGKLAGQDVFLAPAAGLKRALDLTVNEYQGGQDFVAAWDTRSGQFRPGFPSPVNDLQFLTGPAVADLGGLPGDEVVGGTASTDLYGLDALGRPASGDWPKLSGDWTVANPAVGPFGDGDRQVLVTATRNGKVFAYDTGADRCAGGGWPRFHHDNANSGDARRDAVAPGRVRDLRADATTLRFTAPGDDLLCGTVAAYELRAGDGPWRRVEPAAAAGPGATQVLAVPGTGRVSVRAVDEQGNVGRPASATRR